MKRLRCYKATGLRAEKAFSLTELLVSVVVLFILAALLIPVVQHLIESTRYSKCMSQLRSVALKRILVATENEGELSWYQSRQSLRGMWWHKTFSGDNFEGFNQMMSCPSREPYAMRYTHGGRTQYATYRYNKYLGYQNPADVWIYPLQTLSTVPAPQLIPMIACDGFTDPTSSRDDLGFETWRPDLFVHRNGTAGAFVFVDGHVRKSHLHPDPEVVFNPARVNRPR